MVDIGKTDVFILHRGETKYVFVDALSRGLPGRIVFEDWNHLKTKEIFSTIVDRLRVAAVVVVVLSANFHRSAWPLEELRIAQQHSKCFVVVFYDVTLKTVRGWKFKDAKKDYRRSSILLSKSSIATVESEWRKAISVILGIGGLEYDSTSKSFVVFVAEVAREVEKKLKPKTRGECMVVGLNDVVEVLMAAVEKDNAVKKIVGIYNFGGTGKTTLATKLYDEHRAKYPRACFLSSIRTEANPSRGLEGIKALQLRLWESLLGSSRPAGFQDEVDGRKGLNENLHDMEVLLVLDDIGEEGDGFLQRIFDIHVLGPGSLIIITSRDKAALVHAGCTHYKEMDLLKPPHARQLFLFHFLGGHTGNHENSVSVSYIAEALDDTIVEVLALCKGLPLSLKVMGSLLRARSAESRCDLRDRLKMAGELAVEGKNLFKQLRISFDSLASDEKRIFLDVACNLIGWVKEDVMPMWQRCVARWTPALSLETLQNRCLLIVDEEGRLNMHDQLRDMGRRIERDDMTDCQNEDASRERIWEVDALHVCPQDATWSSFSALRHLDLSACTSIGCLPDSFGELKSLQSLSIRSCSSLQGISETFGQLESLKFFNASSCDLLQCLPRSFGLLHGLQHLELKTCFKMAKLPQTFGELAGLEYLDLSICLQLTELPDSFGQLQRLKFLDLTGCTRLKGLPDNFSALKKLEILDLYYCSHLDLRSNYFASLSALQYVDLGKARAYSNAGFEKRFRTRTYAQLMKRARDAESPRSFLSMYRSGLDVSALSEKIHLSEQGLACQLQGMFTHPDLAFGDLKQILRPMNDRDFFIEPRDLFKNS